MNLSPKPFRSIPLMLTLSLGLLGSHFLFPHLQAQDRDFTQIETHENSLGMKFVSFSTAKVKLATLETRKKDFNLFLRETGRTPVPDAFFPQDDNHPQVNVTWEDATAFCEWLTKKEHDQGRLSKDSLYRLPTHSEWEAACVLPGSSQATSAVEVRMLKDKSFPWGLNWPPPARVANLANSGIPGVTDDFLYTAPVGSFAPNRLGIYDLSGNVWEWVYESQGTHGWLRGGSWLYFQPEVLVSSYRYEVPLTLRAPTVGFRVLLDESSMSPPVSFSPATAPQPFLDPKSSPFHPARLVAQSGSDDPLSTSLPLLD